jgi:hypothetical protein
VALVRADGSEEHLHVQGTKTLKMEAICSPKMSVPLTRARQRHMPEDNILNCYRREKSYQKIALFEAIQFVLFSNIMLMLTALPWKRK